jgi:hypothetical protein
VSKGPPRRGPSTRRGTSAIRSIDAVTVKGNFVRKGGQPHLREWTLEAAPFRIEIISEEPEKPPHLTLQSPSGSMHVSDFPIFSSATPLSATLGFPSLFALQEGQESRISPIRREYLVNGRYPVNRRPRSPTRYSVCAAPRSWPTPLRLRSYSHQPEKDI